jgi:apoptosis-inducing factor 3
LSKALVTDPSKLEWRSPAELKSKFGVTLRSGLEVSAVDVKNKSVVVSATGERVPYETLILATGGVPRKLPIQGAGLGKVFTLRSVEDAKKIDSGKNASPL